MPTLKTDWISLPHSKVGIHEHQIRVRSLFEEARIFFEFQKEDAEYWESSAYQDLFLTSRALWVRNFFLWTRDNVIPPSQQHELEMWCRLLNSVLAKCNRRFLTCSFNNDCEVLLNLSIDLQAWLQGFSFGEHANLYEHLDAISLGICRDCGSELERILNLDILQETVAICRSHFTRVLHSDAPLLTNNPKSIRELQRVLGLLVSQLTNSLVVPNTLQSSTQSTAKQDCPIRLLQMTANPNVVISSSHTEEWKEKLSRGEYMVISTLISIYPHSATANQIMEMLGNKVGDVRRVLNNLVKRLPWRNALLKNQPLQSGRGYECDWKIR